MWQCPAGSISQSPQHPRGGAPRRAASFPAPLRRGLLGSSPHSLARAQERCRCQGRAAPAQLIGHPGDARVPAIWRGHRQSSGANTALVGQVERAFTSRRGTSWFGAQCRCGFALTGAGAANAVCERCSAGAAGEMLCQAPPEQAR